jgi:ketosteroid isomerase-like protein
MKTFSQIQEEDLKIVITKIMKDQEVAWNKGDIDGFMGSYWNDDSLKFIGKSGITFGWKNTLANYKKSYPDKATMGILSFSIITVEKLSETSCYVIGKWNLKREKGDVGGYYTLLWKLIDGKWLIVNDHTS